MIQQQGSPLKNSGANTADWIDRVKGRVIYAYDIGYLLEEATDLAGSDLATRMARDKGFIQGTEQGLAEIEQGRYSRIEDIKKKLGDL